MDYVREIHLPIWGHQLEGQRAVEMLEMEALGDPICALPIPCKSTGEQARTWHPAAALWDGRQLRSSQPKAGTRTPTTPHPTALLEPGGRHTQDILLLPFWSPQVCPSPSALQLSYLRHGVHTVHTGHTP